MGLAARLLLALGVVCLLLGAYLLSQTAAFGTRCAPRARSAAIARSATAMHCDIARACVSRPPPATSSLSKGNSPPPRSVLPTGEQIPVVYPRADPQKARVALFTDNWLGPIVAGVVGLVALIGGVFVRRAVTRGLSAGPGKPGESRKQ